jgi:hypothetical protein
MIASKFKFFVACARALRELDIARLLLVVVVAGDFLDLRLWTILTATGVEFDD